MGICYVFDNCGGSGDERMGGGDGDVATHKRQTSAVCHLVTGVKFSPFFTAPLKPRQKIVM